MKTLNPRQINWGKEIDRRAAVLVEQSIGNPYFRLCAFKTAAMLFPPLCLLALVLWWDKMPQINGWRPKRWRTPSTPNA